MSKMSFLDKLGILMEVTKNSFGIIILLIGIIGLGILFFQTNKKAANRNKIVYLMISVFILVVLLMTYHASLGKIFDYMMNHLFIAIYFPNIAIYMAALIAMNIILWISLFHYKTSEMIKKLNIVVYIIMNYLLALILNIINTENLDVFTQQSIYENKHATALIELSSTVFMVWIIFLVLYKIILIYMRKDYRPKVKKIVVEKEVKKLPENYIPINTPSVVKGTTWKPTWQEKALLQTLENTFTLDDYRLLSKILKEEQKKQRKTANPIKKEITNIIERKEVLPTQVKIKVEEEVNKEEETYTELERLYRGIR